VANVFKQISVNVKSDTGKRTARPIHNNDRKYFFK